VSSRAEDVKEQIEFLDYLLVHEKFDMAREKKGYNLAVIAYEAQNKDLSLALISRASQFGREGINWSRDLLEVLIKAEDYESMEVVCQDKTLQLGHDSSLEFAEMYVESILFDKEEREKVFAPIFATKSFNSAFSFQINDENGNIVEKSLLSIAVKNGDDRLVDILLKRGADINKKDIDKKGNKELFSPLSQAAFLLHIESQKNPEDRSEVLMKSYEKITNSLLESAAADINLDIIISDKVRIPLLTMLVAKNLITIETLEKYGNRIDYTTKDQDENNLLAAAISSGNLELAKFFIEKNSN
jgi:ankyrin repeat protein